MLATDMPSAERLLKDHLRQVPTDVPAIRMLAEVAVRCGENRAAGHLLDRCLELTPAFQAARYARAVLLHRDNQAAEALAEVERLLAARTAARAAKDWPASDRVRDELARMGVTVKDGPQGPTWSRG
jgi:cysteinyl-tRNA synthetase